MLDLVTVFAVTLLAASAPVQIVPEEVARVYEELQATPVRGRMQALAQMPAAMQSAVWTRHYRVTLERHPELTTDQRIVIQDALVLLTPELFAIEPSDPRWKDLVDAPLRVLQEKARKAFPDRKFARELFLQLGPEAPPKEAPERPRDRSDLDAGTPRANRPRLVQSNYDDCGCSTDSDWCDWSAIGTLAEVVCRAEWCRLKTSGCGTLGRYVCNGLCMIKRS